LGSLAAVEAVPDMGVLPILEDEPRFDTQTTPFELSLAHLVERRVEKFHGPLSTRLPELDQVAAAVVDRSLVAKYPHYQAEPPPGPVVAIAVDGCVSWSAR